LFEPEYLTIVSGSPEDRRRFLDAVLSACDKQYLKTLIHYRRVLKQRNSLLRSRQPQKIKQEIFVWDLKLTELAGYIYQTRQQFTNWLAERLVAQYQQLSGSPLELNLAYRSSVTGENYTSRLLEKLTDLFERDTLLGYTSAGPHRDDLAITIGNKEAQLSASRGEVRSIVLAFKLLELEYLEQQTGQTPILLFDDVFSELDSNRRGRLLQKLSGYQIILTTTDLRNLKTTLPASHAIIALENSKR
jgi:DNA replication and repair protein RecF